MPARKPAAARIEVISLQSGSDGNSYYVEAGGVGLLIDAGISGRQAATRLSRFSRDIQRCKCLFISHDHRDHARCMGVYHRQFQLPIAITRNTYHAVVQRHRPGAIDLKQVLFFSPGKTLSIEAQEGPLQVHSLRTPHDGVDCLAFIVEYDGRRLGILSDLGHPFDALYPLMATLDAVVIESNYDPDMLRGGPYPPSLQERICGEGGHLSNQEAAELVAVGARSNRLQWATLCHLSRENNSPSVARQTHRAIVPPQVELHVADRMDASGPWFI